MNRILPLRLLSLATAAALAVGCASTPRTPPEVLALQSDLHRLQTDPRIAPLAAPELRDAELAVSVITADMHRMRPVDYDQSLYLARRLIDIAEAEGLARHAVARGQELDGEHDRLLADARSRDAALARRAAEDARLRAEEERRMSEFARLQAERDRHAAELARMDADRARAEAEQARRSMSELQVLLVELEAKQTERGLVLTIGDVLFETDRADLKPGAARQLDKLVAALRDHPDLVVAIEGHTDSTGSHGYNMALSERRADAVRSHLARNGVDPRRLRAVGLGPDYPVASNNNPAGRQQNRRVEIVLQDPAGQRLGARDDD
jgi:outer membrane protein OmpA-like peptidoglycan-associated protein